MRRRLPARPRPRPGRLTPVRAALAVAAIVTPLACDDASTTTAVPSVLETTTTPSVPETATAATSVTPSVTPSTAPSVAPSTAPSIARSTTVAAATTTSTTTTVADTGSGRYPAQPPGVAWPTTTWQTAPLPDSIDRSLLDRTVDLAFGEPDASARLRAVVIVHGGAIVYERYHPLDGLQTVFDSWSVAKSVTAALTGMLVDDGLLDPSAPAPVPEWQGADDPRAAITLDHLLRMSSGLAWEEKYEPDGLPLQMLQAPHAADVPLAQPLVHEPGTVWNYSTGTSAIIADVLADTLGGPDELDAFIHERLMAPLGIRSTVLRTDATGTFLGGIGFDSTARDFARFGLLHLRGGLWDGRRLLSEQWIDYVRAPASTSERYGAHWWLVTGADSFSAQGLFGQHIVVDVAHDLVVVTTATAGGDSRAITALILAQFASLPT